MSILVNVGFSTTFENQSSDDDNFGSSHSQPSNVNGSVRFRSKGKLNINDTEATTRSNTIIGSIIWSNNTLGI